MALQRFRVPEQEASREEHQIGNADEVGSMNKKNNGKEYEYMFYDQIELVKTAVLDDEE